MIGKKHQLYLNYQRDNFMTKTKLAKAIAYAIAGTALTAGSASTASASATTMYNLTSAAGIDYSDHTTACAPCNGGAGTDGWVWGFDQGESIGFAPQGSTHSVASWAGTEGTHTTPFGYNGGGILNWALQMTSAGTAEISSQDSLTRYGVGADIDTAKGAWSDASKSGAFGWRHDLDYGLFKSDTGGTITLNAQGINQSGTNFGFTIFKGMDASTVAYNHHGSWNNNNNTQIGAPNGVSLPGGNTQFGATNAEAAANIVAYSIGGDTPSNLNTINFNADPGQIYTIVLGGYRNGGWGETVDGYKLNITAVSSIPVPGAVWLFSSAMAGLIGFGRRSHKSTT